MIGIIFKMKKQIPKIIRIFVNKEFLKTFGIKNGNEIKIILKQEV